MERFLSQCARYIFEKHAGSLQNICLVFPNRRSGVFFTSYLQKQIETPVIGPQVTTVNELVRSYSDWNSGEKLELISILYDVFCKHTKSTESFDEFYFWGEILLADFNDIDRYLVNAKDLFTNITDLKEIESIFDYLTDDQKKALEQFWGNIAASDKSAFREKYISIWDKLYPIYAEFKQQLRQSEQAFPGMIDRDVVECAKEGGLSFDFQQYYFIGLNALNSCEIQLFDALQKVGKATFLWDYDSSYLDDDQNEAGYFLRQNLRRFPAPEDFDLNTTVFSQRKQIKLVAVSSVYGQAQEMPLFLEDTAMNYKKQFDNTAVVLADESLLFPALGAIPENIGTINITMGYPVRNSVVYGFILLLVNLLKNKRKEKKGYTAFHRYVTDILNHQLLGDREKEKTAEYVTMLKQMNRISVDLSEIDFSPLHHQIFSLPEKTDNYSRYFLSVLGMLYHQQKESGDLMLLELIYSIYQAIEKLDAVVRKALGKHQHPLTETIYFRLFSQYIGQISVAFEGEPLSGLQVMGILETRCLDFENLIILGLNENKWPRKFTAPSFIPFNIRKGFGLPGIDEQDAMYGYYFYRLIQRAKNTTATYSVVKEGIGTGELSRYGYQLQYDSVHKPEMLNLDFVFANDPVDSIYIPGSKDISRRLVENNTEKHPLSPSAINTYLNCPLKFYFHYVVRLPEPDEVKEEIDGVLFGNIFHDSMEELYSGFVGKEIDKSDLEQLSKNRMLINNEITKQIARHYFKQEPPFKKAIVLEGKSLLIFENIKTYLFQLIRQDMDYAPFKVVSLEQSYKRRFEVNGQQLWVGGKIDRIDEKNGRIRVLDYKTGNVKYLSAPSVEDIFERDAKDPKKEILQALIYCWGLTEQMPETDIQPGIYSLRKLFESKFKWEIEINRRQIVFRDVEPEFEDELQKLLAEIYNEGIGFKQTEFTDKCKYCPYSGICRRY